MAFFLLVAPSALLCGAIAPGAMGWSSMLNVPWKRWVAGLSAAAIVPPAAAVLLTCVRGVPGVVLVLETESCDVFDVW
jgi:hypothetical protein